MKVLRYFQGVTSDFLIQFHGEARWENRFQGFPSFEGRVSVCRSGSNGRNSCMGLSHDRSTFAWRAEQAFISGQMLPWLGMSWSQGSLCLCSLVGTSNITKLESWVQMLAIPKILRTRKNNKYNSNNNRQQKPQIAVAAAASKAATTIRPSLSQRTPPGVP